MKNNANQWRVFKRFMSYLKPYKFLTTLALALLLLTTVVGSVIPLIASYFINHSLADINQIAMLTLVGYYLMYVLQTITQYLGNFYFACVSYSVVRDIRRDAFANTEKLGMAYFDQTPVGSIVSRLTNDTEAISDMFSGILSSFISVIFIFTVALLTMLRLNAALTGWVAVFLPFIFILVNLYRKKSAAVIEKTRALLSDINSKLSESIEGIRIIQSFSQEDRLKDEFETINEGYVLYANRSMVLDSLFLRSAMSLLKLLTYAILMAYFGFRGMEIGTSAGLMYAFIRYVNRSFDTLIEVTQNSSALQTSMVSAGRVFDLIDERQYEPGQKNGEATVQAENIEFKNISFSCDGERQILDNILFKINQGETIVFVGSTGSGKSPTINVFMRFYEFQSGEVSLDGADIREYPKEELRRNISLVLQGPFPYHGTTKSNIKMYQDISDETVQATAMFVDADQFIQKLPEKYETKVTERGPSFSTGQRQLLVFARTAASQSKILILDEATANTDSEIEIVVQESLKKMRQGWTTVAIAHCLSTIQDANCIYVLDKGKIIKSSGHDELLSQKGTYYRMYQLQTGMTES